LVSNRNIFIKTYFKFFPTRAEFRATIFGMKKYFFAETYTAVTGKKTRE
jgi:hypothetical protein